MEPGEVSESGRETEPGRQLDSDRQREQEVQVGDQEPEGGGWSRGSQRVNDYAGQNRGSGRGRGIWLILVLLVAAVFIMFPVFWAVGLLLQVDSVGSGPASIFVLVLWALLAALVAVGAGLFALGVLKRSV